MKFTATPEFKYSFLMHSVSVVAVKITAEGISALKQVPYNSLFEGSPISESKIKSERWIDWNSFVDWIDWVDEQPFGPLDWEQVGRSATSTKSMKFVQTIIRSAVSIRLAYRIGSEWFGKSMFPTIESSVDYVGQHNLVNTLVLDKTAKPCPKIFKAFIGSLSMVPVQSFGLAPANVTLEHNGNVAKFYIEVPQQHTVWSWLRARISAFFSYQKIFNELEDQQRQLHESAKLLYKEREELKNFIKLFPDGVFIYRDGIVHYANERVSQYLNVELSEILGKDMLQYVNASSHALIKSRMGELIANPTKINPPVEFSMIRRGASEPFIVECTSINTMFEGESSVLVVMRDTNERKKLQIKLMQNDRLMSLGQLAAGVGHEINNPLTSILLKLELLQEKKASTMECPEVKKVLAEIQHGLERIKYIASDLKTLARNRDEDLLSNLEVNRVLQATIHMIRNEVEHRAKFIFEAGDVGPVYANEARLGQVFLNILINAIQAIEPGKADENSISVKTYGSDSRVIIEITDTGTGIPEEMKDRIFQPFQTTKPMGLGTGLGLSICDSIVRMYKGSIEFESKPGFGSLFRVILPLSEMKDVPAIAPPFEDVLNSESSNSNAVERSIMIVDDDQEVLDIFNEFISRNYKVRAFNDSRDALEVLAKGQTFDCIVCDLMMPNVGGVEFYQRLQEVSPVHLNKIIFVTGGSFTSATDQFLRNPGIVFFEKPISYKELLKAIGVIVER